MHSIVHFRHFIFSYREGRQSSKATPAHRFNDFTIRSYAPVAFRHFRERFNIKPEDFLVIVYSLAESHCILLRQKYAV
jgi:hypothetical protein